MPRLAREKSQSGIYHVTIRSNDQNIIFLNDEDYQLYMDTLIEHQFKCEFTLYAYCLMNNHIHLLIHENETVSNISKTMQRINLTFVKRYNKKYKRQGHLFQSRFNSKAVDDEDYFRTVIRYIHQNPVRANAVKNIIHYKWSSIHEYAHVSKICETKKALELFDDKNTPCKESFFKHHRYFPNNDELPEFLQEDLYKLKDPEAILLIKSLAGVDDPKTVGNLNKANRNTIIMALKQHFMSDRQISRLTGINRYTIINIKTKQG
jgi:REP element-mobilizing transposase RayT